MVAAWSGSLHTPRVRSVGEWEIYEPIHPVYEARRDDRQRLTALVPVLTDWRRPVYESWRDSSGQQWGERVGWERMQ